MHSKYLNMINKILLILIVFLAFIMRFWHVESIPPGINRDEASIGYTAYSILKTGKDEYGVSWPISIKSFGDWKLPLYIYLDIIPVKFNSLTELSVRIPSVFFGVLTIVFVYLLTKQIFDLERNKYKIPLLSAFLLSVSPWHIHFSRVASEANISVFLTCVGLYLFFRGLRSKSYLFLSAVLLSLSLYTYHGSHVFLPLLFLMLIFILLKEKKGIKFVLVFTVPVFVLGSIIMANTLFTADKTKISGLTYLSDISMVYSKITIPRFDHLSYSSITAKLFHNKPFFLAENFLDGYIRSFSPEFLFITGGGNNQHNIPDFGNLMLIEAPFILLGIYYLFHKRFKWRYFLLYWLLISPIPAAITRDAPHSARMLAVLPLPHILSALGLFELVQLIFNNGKKKIFIFVVSGLFVINFSIFTDRYFIHFPKIMETFWGSGYKSLVKVLSSKSNNYNEIIMDRPNYSPYIYYLFYTKTDPSYYQKNVVRYPEDSEGFQHVQQIGNLTFKQIDWSDDFLRPDNLLVSWVESTPKGATNSAIIVDKTLLDRIQSKYGQSYNLHIGDIIENRLIDVIKLDNGQPQFNLIEVKKRINNVQE